MRTRKRVSIQKLFKWTSSSLDVRGPVRRLAAAPSGPVRQLTAAVCGPVRRLAARRGHPWAASIGAIAATLVTFAVRRPPSIARLTPFCCAANPFNIDRSTNNWCYRTRYRICFIARFPYFWSRTRTQNTSPTYCNHCIGIAVAFILLPGNLNWAPAFVTYFELDLMTVCSSP